MTSLASQTADPVGNPLAGFPNPGSGRSDRTRVTEPGEAARKRADGRPEGAGPAHFRSRRSRTRGSDGPGTKGTVR